MLEHFFLGNHWQENHWTMAQDVSFHLFLLILFLFRSIIATKSAYKILEGCAQRLLSYKTFLWEQAEKCSRCKFSFFFFIFFFCSVIATRFAYKISEGCDQRLLNYKIFWWKQAEKCSRCEFSFVFFNSFLILLHYSYQICVQSFRRLCPAVIKLQKIFIETGRKMLQVWIFILFFYLFLILLRYSYEICVQIFRRLRPAVIKLQKY